MWLSLSIANSERFFVHVVPSEVTSILFELDMIREFELKLVTLSTVAAEFVENAVAPRCCQIKRRTAPTSLSSARTEGDKKRSILRVVNFAIWDRATQSLDNAIHSAFKDAF